MKNLNQVISRLFAFALMGGNVTDLSHLSTGTLGGKLHAHSKMSNVFYIGDKNFKNSVELDHFFIYEKGLARTKKINYLSSYRFLLRESSDVFQLPLAFQACLTFRESTFQHNALSSVGALGITQITEETYRFLFRALKVGASLYKKPQVSFSDGEITSFLEIKSIYRKMYVRWNLYLKRNGLSPINRNMEAREVLFNPKYALGLSGLYLFYLRERLFQRLDSNEKLKNIELFDLNGSFSPLRRPEFFLLLAGAYNQGARRLFKAIDNDQELNITKWIGYQSKVSETKEYIKSIHSCMLTHSSKVNTSILVRF